MSNWENEGYDESAGLTEIEKIQLDAVILDMAYNNAWLLLTGEITFEELIPSEFNKDKEVVIAYDPNDGPQSEGLENMLSYFVEKEEYEKCSKIKEIMDQIYPTNIKA